MMFINNTLRVMFIFSKHKFTQSAGAVEYTDCTSAEE